MPWNELFWFLVLLTAVTLLGQLWFHFVEWLWRSWGRCLTRKP